MIFKRLDLLGKRIPIKIFLFRTMSASHSNEIVFKEINNKGVIILNRPENLNALNVNMLQQMWLKLKQWEDTKSMVLLKSAGGRAFSAGGDIKFLIESCRIGKLQAALDNIRMEYICDNLIHNYKLPCIALIDGITMGGGAGISVLGKYRVATEKIIFAMPETQIGLIPDAGATYYLSRMPRNLGTFLALTGQRLRGWDAINAGIATHFCQSKNLTKIEEKILETKSESELQEVLQKFHETEANPGFSLDPVMDKIEEYFSENAVEEIIRRLENDGSQWATSTKLLLNKMSPTSLKVTLKTINLARELSLSQCLHMEFCVNSNCIKSNDFHEGVRALVIDRDQKPKWNPSNLEEVTDKIVDKYFKQTEEFDLHSKL